MHTVCGSAADVGKNHIVQTLPVAVCTSGLHVLRAKMLSRIREILRSAVRADRDRPLVLVFPFDFLSHYLRSLQLAQMLRDDADFIFASTKRYQEYVDQAGFPSFEFEDSDADVVLEHSERFDFSWMSEEELERVLAQQRAVIERYRPDIVLGDVSMTLNMAAELCSVRCMKLVNGYMSKYYACPRPVPRSLVLAAPLSLLPSSLQAWLSQRGEKFLLWWMHRNFARIRRRYSLQPRATYLDELAGEITLICDLPELFPQRTLPENYHLIGPLYHREVEADAALKAFLRPGRKTMLVTVGSTGDQSRLLWLLDSRLSEWNVVMTGRNSDRLVAPHILRAQFIAHHTVLPYCDLLVCHGGNGSIYQALEHAVPILAHTNFFEQEYNMARVEECGLGAVIPANASVDEVLELVSYWATQRANDALLTMQRCVVTAVNAQANST